MTDRPKTCPNGHTIEGWIWRPDKHSPTIYGTWQSVCAICGEIVRHAEPRPRPAMVPFQGRKGECYD